MAGFSVDNFVANVNDAARQYLFYVKINNPKSTLGMDKTTYLVRSSSLPSDTIEAMETHWQGMPYNVGSNHTFDDWTVTFIVDADAQVRKDFLDWQKMIHNPETNVHGEPSEYMRPQTAELLNSKGEPIMTYKLEYAWPTTVGEISLDYSSKDIATFDVTFKYLYHTHE